MLKNYLKISFKVLLRRKFFTFISLFGISFTLTVLIVATALIDQYISPYGAEKKSDRMLYIQEAKLSGAEIEVLQGVGYGFLDKYVRGTNGVEAMAIFAFFPAQISYINGKKDFSVVKQTNAEYWEVFDFDFVEGDGFTKDEVNNASNVAVINESKKESFFQDKSAIGQTITVQHKTYRVVGVVKNTSPLRQATYADIWISMTPPVNVVQKKDLTGNFSAVLLAKSRADIPLIREEFQSAVKRVDLSGYKGINSFSVNLNNTVEQLARLYINAKVEEPAPVNKLLSYITLITVLFVILPTVNLISINTNRIMERASEIGVRKAFGASSWTLTLQFLIENTILTTLGAILALLVTRFIFWLMNGTYLLFSADLEINYRVFFSGLVITLIFSLISGVYPAWRMSGLPPALALKGGAK